VNSWESEVKDWLGRSDWRWGGLGRILGGGSILREEFMACFEFFDIIN
jgi:hypothetical protein